MLKLSKKVDYGLIALIHLSRHPERSSWSTREIAENYSIPLELMAKVLQRLAQRGFVISHQGTHGGYSLARQATKISVVDVIEALEGPLSLTDCISGHGVCSQFDKCNIKSPLQVLHDTVLKMFSRLTIAEMNQLGTSQPEFGNRAVPLGSLGDGTPKAAFVVLPS